MTITKFIEKLEELKATHGDIPVAAGSIMGGHYEPDPEVRTEGDWLCAVDQRGDGRGHVFNERWSLFDQVGRLLIGGDTQGKETADERRGQDDVDDSNNDAAPDVGALVNEDDEWIEQVGQDGGDDQHGQQRAKAHHQQGQQ